MYTEADVRPLSEMGHLWDKWDMNFIVPGRGTKWANRTSVLDGEKRLINGSKGSYH